MNKSILYIFLFILIVTGISSCGVERKNPLSKAYHNTTARYNGYFLANERMKTVEATLEENMVYDYNQILPIFPQADGAAIAPVAADLEEIIKKASFPIQRHKNSKWVDDSYILIGKADYYKGEYDEAIKVFKYVNSTSKDEDARHEALVWLMRSFMKNKEPNNAQAVSEFLSTQMLNRDNARELFLTRADYYTPYADTVRIVENLEKAIPLARKKDIQSRLRFVLAQYYQLTNKPQEAYEQYSKILKRNPPYELGFFSKLNLGQVTELSKDNDRARIEKYYRKLLEDSKNDEYRDKIYFEMAKFELKQQKYEQALGYTNLSVRAATQNPTQRGYSYLLAGQIYFDKLQMYQLSQAYYDSAVQSLPTTIPGYEAIRERSEVLTDFAKNLTTITVEDSLQALARLDSTALNARIDSIIEKQRQERIAAAEKLKAEQEAAAQNIGSSFLRNNADNDPMATGSTGGVWYFDNPSAMATAASDFQRRWGNRTLEDNWRRSNQQSLGGGLADADTDETLADTATVFTEEDTEAAKKALMAGIPATEEELQQSNERIEEALYALGNIYNHRLNEPESAIEHYEELLTRYPNTNYAAEVYYSLYLLYQKLGDEKQHEYAAKIRQEFPTSSFAKLLDDPLYASRVSEDNEQVHILYDSAFTNYENKKYVQASAFLNQISEKYPQNDISDKVAFLEVLLIGRTKDAAAFKLALQQFMESYPSSILVERANRLMATVELYESGELNKVKEPEVKNEVKNQAPVYTANKNSPHFFVIAYSNTAPAFKNIETALSNYNTQFNSQEKLELSPFLFGDKTNLIVVKGFKDSKTAMRYADKQLAPNGVLQNAPAEDYSSFVISTENFPAFYRAKNIEEYLTFYRNSYF